MSFLAHPTTAVLDNFNRSNEGPPPSSSWSTPVGIGGLEVISNLCAGDTTGNNLSFWNPGTFGDCEVYCTISTKPATSDVISLDLRLAGTASIVTLDGYLVAVIVQAGTDIIRIQRIDNAVATTLGADVSLEVDAGDKLLFRAVGSAIEVWLHDGAAWSLLAERSDATYASGNIGALLDNTAVRMEDFGGGTYGSIRNLTSTSTQNSTTPTASASTVERQLVTALTQASVTPPVASSVERQLVTSISQGSTTPDDVETTVERQLAAALTQDSVTPAAVATVERQLVTSIAQASSTPDDAESTGDTIRNLTSALIQATVTPNTVSAGVERQLTTNLSQGSATPDTVTVSVERQLVTAVTVGSTSPDTVLVTTERQLTSSLTQASITPAVSAIVERQLVTALIQVTGTPDDVESSSGGAATVAGALTGSFVVNVPSAAFSVALPAAVFSVQSAYALFIVED